MLRVVLFLIWAFILKLTIGLDLCEKSIKDFPEYHNRMLFYFIYFLFIFSNYFFIFVSADITDQMSCWDQQQPDIFFKTYSRI